MIIVHIFRSAMWAGMIFWHILQEVFFNIFFSVYVGFIAIFYRSEEI
nr:MAG TPA: hypothetical protein [Bacteriophage sp.]